MEKVSHKIFRVGVTFFLAITIVFQFLFANLISSFLLILFFCIWGYQRKIFKNGQKVLSNIKADWMLMLFLVIFSSLIFILFYKANPKMFPGYEGYFYLKKVSLTSGSFWLNLLAWAIAEEVFFRKWIFEFVEKITPKWAFIIALMINGRFADFSNNLAMLMVNADNYTKHRDILATIFLNVAGRVLSLTIAKIIS